MALKNGNSRVIGGLTPRRLSDYLGAMMPQEKSLWQQASQQAKQVSKLKSKASKRRQIVLLCETWKRALGGAK